MAQISTTCGGSSRIGGTNLIGGGRNADQRLPTVTVPAAANGEVIDIHFIHEKGSGDNPLPLLLMHGWPGSIAELG